MRCKSYFNELSVANFMFASITLKVRLTPPQSCGKFHYCTPPIFFNLGAGWKWAVDAPTALPAGSVPVPIV